MAKKKVVGKKKAVVGKSVAAKDETKNHEATDTEDNGEFLALKPLDRKVVHLTIEGTSPLCQHKWSEKAKEMMRLKQQGKKTKERETRNPKQEGEEATYYTAKGEYGVPVSALKKCLINAAHKDIGITKVLIKQTVFIRCHDPNGVVKMKCSKPVIQEDYVRVGGKSADLRYRPYFYEWSIPLEVEIDSSAVLLEDLLELFNRAGFGVGLLEMRPERAGELGRFAVSETAGIKCNNV